MEIHEGQTSLAPRHLTAVDTGEVDPAGPQTLAEALAVIQTMRLEIEGLEETARSQGAKIRQLRIDRDHEARTSGLWVEGVEAFRYWQAVTGHGRSEFTTARFELVAPYLKRDGLALVRLAIDAAGFDPYRADEPNRNGITPIYDQWETIFKNRGSFERHVNRAPADRIAMVKEEGLLPPRFTALELRIKTEVILEIEFMADTRPMYERTRLAIHKARQELTQRRIQG